MPIREPPFARHTQFCRDTCRGGPCRHAPPPSRQQRCLGTGSTMQKMCALCALATLHSWHGVLHPRKAVNGEQRTSGRRESHEGIHTNQFPKCMRCEMCGISCIRPGQLMRHGCQEHEENTESCTVGSSRCECGESPYYGMPRLEAIVGESRHTGRVCRVSAGSSMHLDHSLLPPHARHPPPLPRSAVPWAAARFGSGHAAHPSPRPVPIVQRVSEEGTRKVRRGRFDVCLNPKTDGSS